MKFWLMSLATIPIWSPPSRGAWIEILYEKKNADYGDVAPLAGGVD